MIFQLSYLKSWKTVLLKYCTQYVSKFGKLNSGHRTAKGQFSFQSQRSTMTNNVQTTIQLCSFHMLARLHSKSFKLGFSSTYTKNSQIYRLGFEEAEEAEIKLPMFIGSWRKQGNSRKKYLLLFHWVHYSFDCVDDIKLWINLKEMGVPDHLMSLEIPVFGSRRNSYNWTWNNRLVQNWERSVC